ncbi:conserved hypothetical protein [uncultured Desulfatiglans sp.]|uniref:HTH marR-type domain-containing protein n=1 Tax=Uncultured Desulfatiglans sp. TaxID=1748965 RepID=A0A653A747_UNCDX|nr:conserved hypothetical protein [uncultured Desulfatiglans sp.]
MPSQSSAAKNPRLIQEERDVLIGEILYQIRRLGQAGTLYSKELMKYHQISTPQLNCILALHANGPIPASQIARLILVKSSTVTGIIDRLEQKGLVRRVRNSPDRRVIMIELTEAGESLAMNAPPPVQRKIMEGLRKLPRNEVENIRKGLHTLTGMLDMPDLADLEMEDAGEHTPDELGIDLPHR